MKNKTEISPSAQGVAYLRSLDEGLSGDTLAKHFVGDEGRRVAEGWLEIFPQVARQIALRGRYIDDTASSYIEKGVRQMVNIAAGLGSFPYRHKAARKLLRYAEIDVQPMLDFKRGEIASLVARRIIVEPPVAVAYIAVDLAKDDLDDTFERMAGWDLSAPAIFIMEGISYYLPMGTLERVVGAIRRHSAKGSIVVMDYIPARLKDAEIVRHVMGSIADAGEPYYTCPAPDELGRLFDGFTMISDRSLQEIEKDYCADCNTVEFDAIVVAKK